MHNRTKLNEIHLLEMRIFMYQYDKPVETYSNSEKNRAASAKISTHTAQTKKISPLNIIRPN